MSEYNWGQMQQEATIVLEGEFPVTVVETKATKTNDGSKDMIKATFKINAGQYAGRKLFSNFVISPESPGAMRMFFGQLAVFGLDSQFFSSIAGQPPSAIAQALDGRSAIAIVGKGTWNGQEREEIKGYKPALGGHGGGTFVPGLGGNIGGGSANSPFQSQPSPTTFTPATSAPGAVISTESTAQVDGAVPEASNFVEPSTPPPPAPSF